MKTILLPLFQLALSTSSTAFVVQPQLAVTNCAASVLASSDGGSDTNIDTGVNISELRLTPELEKMTAAFQSIDDEQLRYKQLLYMASNSEEVNNLPQSSRTPENKVPGCLSTVFIDGMARYDEAAGDYVIDFMGDSDGLLTKGLVALLIRGVSGNTAEAIQNIDPNFIKVAGIEQSLTPGRNNGFLNMLAVIKKKAEQLAARARDTESPDAADSGVDESETENSDSEIDESMVGFVPNMGPKFNAIVESLQALKPTSLTLVDNSDKHAGHAGNDIDGESHFELAIVAEAFEELSLVQRHKIIYMLLGDIMPQIHALQIQSLTPEEAGR